VGRLEGAVRIANPARAAVLVCHPQPLDGGTLHNPVVFHTDRELNRAGFTSLRFNFRGAGTSEGAHDRGEGEVGDVEAGMRWLRGIAPNLPLLLVGYSFGSWCALRYAVNDPAVAGVVAIGLPVRIYGADAARRLRRPLSVVQPELDEFGPPDEVRAALTGCDPPARLHVIDHGTHLLPGGAATAAEVVAREATALLFAGG
jgi:hypothetical protein